MSPQRKKKRSTKSRRILFGICVCANGVVLNKIIHEPFVVALNSKTNKKNCSPPPDFTKMIKPEVKLKIEHIFSRLVSNFD